MPFAMHEDYFATLPSEARVRLEQVQADVAALGGCVLRHGVPC